MPADTGKPPYRKFGIIYHRFPEMTRAEKGFVVAFVTCGVIMVFLTMHGPMPRAENPLVGFCAAIMGGVLCYWAKHEPAALLGFLLFPFTGRAVQWPSSVLFCVRAFAVLGFFGSVSSFLVAFLPASFYNSPGPGLLLLVLAVAVCFFFLRRRKEPYR